MMPWGSQVSSFFPPAGVFWAGEYEAAGSPGLTRLFAVTGHAPAAGITFDPGCRIRSGQRHAAVARRGARPELRGRPGGSSDHPPLEPVARGPHRGSTQPAAAG